MGLWALWRGGRQLPVHCTLKSTLNDLCFQSAPDLGDCDGKDTVPKCVHVQEDLESMRHQDLGLPQGSRSLSVLFLHILREEEDKTLAKQEENKGRGL
jgi:hypothetical protein